MSQAVKTIPFTKQEMAMVSRTPYVVPTGSFSTLNEVFEIGNDTSVPNQYPTLGYFMIGRGGHTATVGADGSVLIESLHHDSDDASVALPLPFIAVPASSDLSPEERAKYRMRKKQTISGTEYYVYYVKTFAINTTPVVNLVTIANGNIVSSVPYVATAANLTRPPISISNTIYNVADGVHRVVQQPMPITLSQQDIDNIINACILLYGDIKHCTISELAAITGYDETLNTTDPLVPSYTELRCAQIAGFFPVLSLLQQRPPELTFNIALSVSSPRPPAPAP